MDKCGYSSESGRIARDKDATIGISRRRTRHHSRYVSYIIALSSYSYKYTRARTKGEQSQAAICSTIPMQARRSAPEKCLVVLKSFGSPGVTPAEKRQP